MNRKLPHITRARRRVQARSALLLTLIAAAFAALAQLSARAALPLGVLLALQTLLCVLGFGGSAYLGLCVLDGDHSRLLPLRRLSRAQLLWLFALGACCVCPMALMADLIDALRVSPLETAASAPAVSAPVGLFTARLVKSALIAPLAEELFFRGYLLAGLARYGTGRAVAVVSLSFALMHGSPAHALLGALLCLLTLQTGSLLAPFAVHACYNATLLVLDALGLSALVCGWSLVACAVKLLGSAAAVAALKKLYGARTAKGSFSLPAPGALSRRERALLLAAAAALLLSMILGG